VAQSTDPNRVCLEYQFSSEVLLLIIRAVADAEEPRGVLRPDLGRGVPLRSWNGYPVCEEKT